MRRLTASGMLLLSAGIGAALLMGSAPAGAQDDCLGPEVFVKAYGQINTTEVVNRAIVTRNGEIAVTGYRSGASKDVLIARFYSDGTLRYRTLFGGSEDEEGRDIVETQDGDLVVVGYTRSHGDGSDFLLVRLAGDGTPWRWTRYWGGGNGRDEILSAVIEASDGTLWATGSTESFTLAERPEVVIARVDPAGGSLACSRAGSALWDLTGTALAEVFNTDGICVAGTAGGQEILLVKFSHTPSLLWAKRFGSADMTPSVSAIVRTSDACVALAGNVAYWDGFYVDNGSFVLKTDPDAVLDWARWDPGFAHYQSSHVYGLIETRDASLALVGRAYDFWGALTEIIWISKLSFGGSQSWSTGFDAASGGVGTSIAEETHGGLVVGGYILGEDEYYDLMLARCTSTGATCRPSAPGPGFGDWSPEEHALVLSSDGFEAQLSNWSHRFYVVNWNTTIICTAGIHTVCPDGSGDFVAIQDAIDAASDGEIIELCGGAGVVFSGPRNRNLDFQGKTLTLRSAACDPATCVIDCEDLGRAFRFHSGEGPDCVIEGVTIRNGQAGTGTGGGISCEGAAPWIINCRFEDCDAANGGGVYAANVPITIQDCAFAGCSPNAIRTSGGAAQVINCSIDAGSAAGDGIVGVGTAAVIEGCSIMGCAIGISFTQGASVSAKWCLVCQGDTGINLHTCQAQLTNCTVADNSSYGLTVMYATAELDNCIVWGNGEQIHVYTTEPPSGEAIATCCDIQDGWDGEHNIDADPRFCHPDAGNYHIRYDSPCAPPQQPICGLIGALDWTCRLGGWAVWIGAGW